jgi:hypothetical protein
LNPQPSEPQSDALPIELLPPQILIIAIVAIAICGYSNLRRKSCTPRSSLRRPSYAHVLESHGAQARGVEQVLGVEDNWAFYEMPNLGEIQGPEFGPAGGDDQGVNSFGDAVG